MFTQAGRMKTKSGLAKSAAAVLFAVLGGCTTLPVKGLWQAELGIGTCPDERMEIYPTPPGDPARGPTRKQYLKRRK